MERAENFADLIKTFFHLIERIGRKNFEEELE